MAGSYEHVLNGWSLIENMGDAHEAVEELMWLVLSQIGRDEAKRLLQENLYPMVRGEKTEDDHLLEVRQIMKR